MVEYVRPGPALLQPGRDSLPWWQYARQTAAVLAFLVQSGGAAPGDAHSLWARLENNNYLDGERHVFQLLQDLFTAFQVDTHVDEVQEVGDVEPAVSKESSRV